MEGGGAGLWIRFPQLRTGTEYDQGNCHGLHFISLVESIVQDVIKSKVNVKIEGTVGDMIYSFIMYPLPTWTCRRFDKVHVPQSTCTSSQGYSRI